VEGPQAIKMIQMTKNNDELTTFLCILVLRATSSRPTASIRRGAGHSDSPELAERSPVACMPVLGGLQSLSISISLYSLLYQVNFVTLCR